MYENQTYNETINGRLILFFPIRTYTLRQLSYCFISSKKHSYKKITVLHMEEVLDGLCNFSIASKVPSVESLLQRQKQMDVVGARSGVYDGWSTNS